MHPEIAKTLVAQHRDELVQQTASSGGRPPPVPAVAHQLDPDRAGPGRRARSGGRQPRRPGWPARFVAGDHHLGPPFGLMPPADDPAPRAVVRTAPVGGAAYAARPAAAPLRGA